MFFKGWHTLLASRLFDFYLKSNKYKTAAQPLGRLFGDPHATTGSTAASVGVAVAAYERGATILRVHDVREHVEALAVAQAALS